MNSTVVEAVRQAVIVDVSPERAFQVFTEEIGTWWPLDDVHSRLDGAETAVIEPRKGGRVYERAASGAEASWGEVTEWEPPSRLILAWKPNDSPYPPTEVEVRFTPEGDRTRVELEHRGWERLGEDAAEARAGYERGWKPVLARFEDALAR